MDIIDKYGIYLRYCICMSLFYFVYSLFPKFLPLYGDEPHYLITVQSIAKDFDLNSRNQYDDKTYKEFGYNDLNPQGFQLDDQTPFIPPEHGFGLPSLLALPYKVGGLVATQLFLTILGLFAAIMVGHTCDIAGFPRLVGTMACVALATSITWQIHSSRVYPEVPAGCLYVSAMYLFFRIKKNYDERSLRKSEAWLAFLLGMCLAAPFFIYVRFATLIWPLNLLALLMPYTRRLKSMYAGFLFVIFLLVMIWISVYGWSIDHGTGKGNIVFTFEGFFQRFWSTWFDLHHGILVHQPVMIIAPLMAFSVLLKPFFKESKALLPAVATVSLLSYNFLYGLFDSSPGGSFAGRYLSASLPLMSIIAASSISNLDATWLRRFLWAVFTLLLLIGAGFLLESLWIGIHPWLIPPDEWHRLFYFYLYEAPHMHRIQVQPYFPSFSKWIGLLVMGLGILIYLIDHRYRGKMRSLLNQYK